MAASEVQVRQLHLARVAPALTLSLSRGVKHKNFSAKVFKVLLFTKNTVRTRGTIQSARTKSLSTKMSNLDTKKFNSRATLRLARIHVSYLPDHVGVTTVAAHGEWTCLFTLGSGGGRVLE